MKKLWQVTVLTGLCCLTLPLPVTAQQSISVFKQVRQEAEEIRQAYEKQVEKKANIQDAKAVNKGLVQNATNTEQAIQDAHKLAELYQKQNKSLADLKLQLQRNTMPVLKQYNTFSDRKAYLTEAIGNLTKNLEQARDGYAQKVAAVQNADNLGAYWEAQADAAAAKAGDSSNSSVARRQLRNKDGKTNEEAVLEALDRIGHDENRLDEAEAIRAQIMSGATEEEVGTGVQSTAAQQEYESYAAKAASYRSQAEALNQELEAMETQIAQEERDLDALWELLSLLEEIAGLESEQKDNLVQQRENVTYQEELRKENLELNKEKIRLVKVLAEEYYGRYGTAAVEGYNWHNNKGKHGSETYVPVETFVEHGYHEVGVSTGVANVRQAGNSAEFNKTSLLDTQVHYGYRNVHKRYVVKYNVDVNLPTGNSRKRNDLDDDLVPITAGGEGFNVTPGVLVIRRDGEENTWRAGLSYDMRGKYKNNYSNHDNSITPSNILHPKLDWTRATKDYQMRIGADANLNGTAKQSGSTPADYREGNEGWLKAMYNRHLSKASDLMAYFWYRNNGGNHDFFNGGSGGSSTARYYGLEYKYRFDEGHSFYIRQNNMLTTGTYTDEQGTSYGARNKHTFDLAYSAKLQKNLSLNLGLGYFWMTDYAADLDYKGWRYFLYLEGAM